LSAVLDRRMLALAVAVALGAVILVVGQSRASRLSADFTIDYSAGLLLRQGRFDAVYDQRQLAETMQQVAPGAIDLRLPFNKPLAAALPGAVLSLLPLEAAFRVWQAISAALLLLTLLLLQRLAPLGRGGLTLGIVGLLAALPTADTFDEGQITPLLALGAALMVASLPSKRFLPALAAGALLAVKPQYLPAYLAICLAARAWRPLLAAMAGASVVLLSPLAGGWANLAAMAHQAATHVGDVRFEEAWIGDIGPLLPVAWLGLGAVAIFLLGHTLTGWLAWRRPQNLLAFAVVAGVIGVLASPHALPHDLLILTVPAWLSIRLHRDGVLPNPTPALIAVDLALVVDLLHRGMPVAPAVMTVALVWMAWQFRRRAASPARPSPVVRAA
jgi:hypothetical protein